MMHQEYWPLMADLQIGASSHVRMGEGMVGAVLVTGCEF